MQLVFQIILFFLIIYMSYRMIKFTLHVKQRMLFPIVEHDLSMVKSIKNEAFCLPTLSKQKIGMMMQVISIILASAFLIVSILMKGFEWYTYLAVINFNFITYFIVPNPIIGFTEKGILYRMRFIPWEKVKAYEFNPLDVHSFNYYYFAAELTDASELKIDVPFYPVKMIVLSSEMKERLTFILAEKTD